ncbi:ribosomal protein S18-alanine N-acetyltransferase [Streptococcus suis]|nr:ribosomal protein S18-alanine N-acetyltransferase [Streptococcus suis]WNF83436.1 ribosomal protein S18-alanine N-acetyltransferase [Streptococcus suis]
MIEIRKYEGQVDLVPAVYAVLTDVYERSPWTESQVAADMAGADTTYYLAYDEQDVVGFLAVQTVLDEMEILQIAVKTHSQGRGIASQLMAAVRDWEGDIILEVRESNAPAQALYTRQHFTKIGKRKNYYHNPIEDAVLMKREWNGR